MCERQGLFRNPLLGMLYVGLISPAALAQVSVTTETVSFSAGTVIESNVTVKGELRMPEGASAKLPAVVVIHNAGGLEDKTGRDYVEALNQAGFATLELDLFPRGGAPATTRGHVPHTYGSLIYLANNPRIDPARIGVMGFSYGGILSLVSVSKELTDAYTGGQHRFAAHLPLYPVCWAAAAVMDGKIKSYSPTTWRATTDAPVHILAGERDDYGEPDMCPKFVQALPQAVRSRFAVTVYPDAHHGWDTHEDRRYFDRFAASGKGGQVRHWRNAEVAGKSKTFAVEYFAGAMAAK